MSIYMSTNTEKLTFGAMIVAIFGVLLLVNRQTGGMFEGLFIFVFPIPLVAYSARYGLKSSLPVLVCTVLISFLCGTITSNFYAISEAIIGVVYGSRIYAKKDMTHTLVIVVALSAVSELICSVALASLFGIDIGADITEMQNMLNTMLAQAGVDTMEGIFTYDYLKRIYIVSVGFLGAIEGFVVYYLSLQVLRKLRYPIVKATPLFEFYPHRITGVIALLLQFLYQYTFVKPFSNETLQNVTQTLGICGMLYLVFFGFYAVLLIMNIYLRLPRAVGMILSILIMFIFSALLPYLGFAYISLGLHERMAAAVGNTKGQKKEAVPNKDDPVMDGTLNDNQQ